MLTRLASTCQVPDKWMQGNTKVTAMKENDNCYKARIIKVKVIFRQPPPPIKEMDKFNFCNTWEQARSHIYRLHCQIGNALLILHCIIVLWQNGNIRLYINQIIFINLFIRCRQMKPRSVSTFWQVLIRDENMECIYWHMKTKHKTLRYPELLGSLVAKLHSLFNLFWCIATLCENSSSDRILLDSIPLT